MQAALDHLEKNKVFIEDLKTDMVPLSVAYKAIEMAIDNQITQVMETLETSMGGLIGDIENITTVDND
jgi:sensor c-di-GMP phosphodiesterase-like protein